MAKDYFQDIVPPNNEKRPSRAAERRVPIKAEKEPDPPPPLADFADDDLDSLPQRSIRNIAPVRQRPRMGDMREPTERADMPNAPRGSSKWPLIAAGIAVVVIGTLGLFAFRSTTVDVTPRSHPIVFDQGAHLTAYPAASATAGQLPYTVETSDMDDSEVVPSNGTEHAETKASGSVTIVNDYSDTPSKLIKNTRFEAPGGLIYRVPADVEVPARSGGKPGEVTVTVVADAAGDQYNIGPTSRLTLPGLKSNPAMYTNIYARSSAAMTGGFSGDRPAVESGSMQGALTTIRARIEQKIRDAIGSRPDVTIFPDLVRITYQESPSTPEAGGGLRIHEKAHVEMPVFARVAFAQAVGRLVSADSEGASVRIEPGQGYAAKTDQVTTLNLGTQPIDITLAGQATLVWDVDSTALSQALSGKDESAFQGIVNGFPGIQEAHARIQPFWKSSFPSDPTKIKVTVLPPKQPTP